MWKQCYTASKRFPKCIRFVIWLVRGRPESVDYIRDKRSYKRAPLFHCLKFRYTSAPFYFRTIAQLRGKREEKKKNFYKPLTKYREQTGRVASSAQWEEGPWLFWQITALCCLFKDFATEKRMTSKLLPPQNETFSPLSTSSMVKHLRAHIKAFWNGGW